MLNRFQRFFLNPALRNKKYGLFVVLLISCCAFSIAIERRTDSSSARFLVISDWGGFASDNQKLVASAMGSEASRINAQFVITNGDNYHGAGITGEKDPRWKSEFEDIYTSPSLQIPWYASLGNHDYRGNVEGEIAYSKLSRRWILPARYYSHKAQISGTDSILIIHLDTSPFVEEYHEKGSKYGSVKGQDPEKQLKWLDSLLTVSKTCWTMVVGHHSIYSAAPWHGDTKELADKVLPVLKKHNVLIYASGHDHVLQHLKEGNMHFFICGGGEEFRDVSQRADVVFGVGSLGFLSVTVRKDKLSASYIDEHCKVLHTAVIENTAMPK